MFLSVRNERRGGQERRAGVIMTDQGRIRCSRGGVQRTRPPSRGGSMFRHLGPGGSGVEGKEALRELASELGVEETGVVKSAVKPDVERDLPVMWRKISGRRLLL